jgi:hypothetical protein
MSTYHPVAEYVDMMMCVVVKVAVCGAIIRYRRLSVMGKTQNARTSYSNAFDPMARHWKTEDAALHYADGASCGDRVDHA